MTEGGGSSSGQAGWAGEHARATLREGRVRQQVEIRAQGPAGAEAVYQASGPGEDNTSRGRK